MRMSVGRETPKRTHASVDMHTTNTNIYPNYDGFAVAPSLRIGAVHVSNLFGSTTPNTFAGLSATCLSCHTQRRVWRRCNYRRSLEGGGGGEESRTSQEGRGGEQEAGEGGGGDVRDLLRQAPGPREGRPLMRKFAPPFVVVVVVFLSCTVC